MKQVFPDIILVPAAGARALMWQEMSGVSRTSRGRFIFPVLTSEDLTLMMIKLAGQFRWELCRSMMGGRWNDISYNSLTSVYADYIDTYRKNKNLTPEAKERIRSQIKRHNNNLRNIFTYDYELWLRYEYLGSRKLNKEVRAIMYQFCPFGASKRKLLLNQPVFSDIAIRFENERKKIVREIENAMRTIQRQGMTWNLSWKITSGFIRSFRRDIFLAFNLNRSPFQYTLLVENCRNILKIRKPL